MKPAGRPEFSETGNSETGNEIPRRGRSGLAKLRGAEFRSQFPNRLLAVLPAVLLAAGCGYHVSGNADLLPTTVKTIAVPAFSNVTTRYQLARMLPEDITREFISRTRYRVVSDPAQADAVLSGALTNFVALPTTVDPATGRGTGVQVVVTLQLRLTERATGKVLWNRPGAEYRERYEISIDPEKYFDESGTAMIRVSQDVARSVVSGVLENF